MTAPAGLARGGVIIGLDDEFDQAVSDDNDICTALAAEAILSRARDELRKLPAVRSNERGAMCPHDAADDLSVWVSDFAAFAADLSRTQTFRRAAA